MYSACIHVHSGCCHPIQVAALEKQTEELGPVKGEQAEAIARPEEAPVEPRGEYCLPVPLPPLPPT